MEDVHAGLVLEEHLIEQTENVLDGLVLAERVQQREKGLRRLWAISLEEFTAILRLHCLIGGDELEVPIGNHLRLVVRLPGDWSLANVDCLLVQDRGGRHSTYRAGESIEGDN